MEEIDSPAPPPVTEKVKPVKEVKARAPPPAVVQPTEQTQQRLTRRQLAAESRKRDLERWKKEGQLRYRNNGEINVEGMHVSQLITASAHDCGWEPRFFWEELGYVHDEVRRLMERLDSGLRIGQSYLDGLKEMCAWSRELEDIPRYVKSVMGAEVDEIRDYGKRAMAIIFITMINQIRDDRGLMVSDPIETQMVLYPEVKRAEKPTFAKPAMGVSKPETSKANTGIRKDWESKQRYGPSGGGQRLMSGTQTPDLSKKIGGISVADTPEKQAGTQVFLQRKRSSDVTGPNVGDKQRPAGGTVKKAKGKEEDEARARERETNLKEWRKEGANNFVMQYNGLPKGDALFGISPIDGPSMVEGRHWRATVQQGNLPTAHEIAVDFGTRVPETLSKVRPNSPLKLALFKRILIAAMKNVRLDTDTADLFSDSKTLMNRQLERYRAEMTGNQEELLLSDRNVNAIQTLWIRQVRNAEEELNSSIDYPICIQRAGANDPNTQTYNEVVKAFEDRWEKLVNIRRVNWIQEYVREDDEIRAEVKTAVSQLRYLPAVEKLIFTDKKLAIDIGARTLVETVVDGKQTVMDDSTSDT